MKASTHTSAMMASEDRAQQQIMGRGRGGEIRREGERGGERQRGRERQIEKMMRKMLWAHCQVCFYHS